MARYFTAAAVISEGGGGAARTILQQRESTTRQQCKSHSLAFSMAAFVGYHIEGTGYEFYVANTEIG